MHENHFNEAAKNWDSPEKSERSAVFARKIKERVKLPGQARVLDIGCGTGLLSFEFRGEAGAIVGIDTSKGMLEVFREKARQVPGALALELDLETQELEGQEPFDLIVSSLAFHHLRDPAAMLARVKNALAPEGRIAVIDLDREDGSFHADPAGQGVHHSGFSAEAVAAWAKAAGLRLVSRELVHELDKHGKRYPVFLALLAR